jgi:poly(3-hydroxyalkanoate) synthetase
VLRVGRMIHWMDEARRRVGRALDAFGLGPQETPHRVVAEMPGARLRAYHDQERADGPVLFIIPAPFKKAYLWDLLPEVSVVRRCLAGGLRVYLLEWLIPTRHEDEFGLAESLWVTFPAACGVSPIDGHLQTAIPRRLRRGSFIGPASVPVLGPVLD